MFELIKGLRGYFKRRKERMIKFATVIHCIARLIMIKVMSNIVRKEIGELSKRIDCFKEQQSEIVPKKE